MPAKSQRSTKSAKPANQKLTPTQVITRLMDVIHALPAQVADLPEQLRSRKHWQKTFSPSNKRAKPVMEVLRELPAFTNHAPKSNTAAAWTRVFEKHMGLEQVPG